MAIINANEYDDIVKLILTKNFEKKIILLSLSLSLSDWHYKGRLQILLYWLGFSTQVLKLKRHFLSTSNSKWGNREYVSTIKLWVPRKCLFKCWVNIPVPLFGNIEVPSFGHDIFSVPPIQNGGTEIMSPQSNYGYRENVSSSVGLTFRFPRLVTFRFPRLVNQSNVSKKCIKILFFFISGALS